MQLMGQLVEEVALQLQRPLLGFKVSGQQQLVTLSRFRDHPPLQPQHFAAELKHAPTIAFFELMQGMTWGIQGKGMTTAISDRIQ